MDGKHSPTKVGDADDLTKRIEAANAELQCLANATTSARGSESINTPVNLFACEEKDGKLVVASHLFGNFPGCPIDLQFFFKLEGHRIASLEIVP
jgi:hypothetical protein